MDRRSGSSSSDDVVIKLQAVEAALQEVAKTQRIANPAALGLFAFGLTTALLQGVFTGIAEKETSHLVYGFGMFYGGLTQLLVGMWEVKRNNVFGATAFSSYGAFWMSLCFYSILKTMGIFSPLVEGEQMMLILWGILTFILFVGTIKLNVGLMTLFFSLGTLFFLIAAGHPEPDGLCMQIAGWWGIWTAAVAFYCGAADVLNEVWGCILLPLGQVKNFSKRSELSKDVHDISQRAAQLNSKHENELFSHEMELMKGTQQV